jgi:1-deoxy-D-xylulose-5-phosphate synthase
MDVPPASYPLLETISSPTDLRKLPASKLTELARELRQFLIHSVATRGGIGHGRAHVGAALCI